MNQPAADVVESFKRLTPEDQTGAYIEIEKIWKEQQQDGTKSNTETHPPQR